MKHTRHNHPIKENDIDSRIKQALDSPKTLDVERFTTRVMKHLVEEKTRENPLRSFWNDIRSRLWFMSHPIMTASAGMIIMVTALAVTLLVLVNQQGAIVESHALPDFNFGPPVPRTTAPDTLLARMDADSILLHTQTHLISNDPLLRPHSVWEQEPGNFKELKSQRMREKVQ